MSRVPVVLIAAAVIAFAGCGQNPQNTVENAASVNPGPASTAPARNTAPSTTTVPAGTLLDVRLNETLNSGTTTSGENFSALVIEDVMAGNRVAIPSGSTVYGTVTEVVPAKRGAGNAKMTLAFTRLDLPGGYSSGLVASMSESTASKKKRNAAVIGGSAAGGALLGRIIGKDTKGAVVGAIVGGGIGTGVVMSKEGVQVNLPAGAELTIELDESIKVPNR